MVQVAPSRPPRFIDPMTTLSSSAPSRSSSSTTSGVPSTPSTSGWLQRLDEPGQQRAPVGHRHRVAAGGQRAAGRVVGGDEEQRAAVVDDRGRAAGARRRPWRPRRDRWPGWPAARASCRRAGSGALSAICGDGRGRRGPRGDQRVELGRGGHGVGAGQPARRPARRRRWRTPRSRAGSQPDSRPWTSAPPNASPAPRPHTTSTGCGRYDGGPGRGRDQHALAAHLDQRELDAPGEQPVGGLVRVAGADRDLDLGAVADGRRSRGRASRRTRRAPPPATARTSRASRGPGPSSGRSRARVGRGAGPASRAGCRGPARRSPRCR